MNHVGTPCLCKQRLCPACSSCSFFLSSRQTCLVSPLSTEGFRKQADSWWALGWSKRFLTGCATAWRAGWLETGWKLDVSMSALVPFWIPFSGFNVDYKQGTAGGREPFSLQLEAKPSSNSCSVPPLLRKESGCLSQTSHWQEFCPQSDGHMFPVPSSEGFCWVISSKPRPRN